MATSSASCTMPEAETPQAAAWPTVATNGARPINAAMANRLYSTGAAAGDFQVWSFSDGYLFAQDPANPGAPGKSNSLYVAVQSLTP